MESVFVEELPQGMVPVVNIPNDTPVEKTDFPFSSRSRCKQVLGYGWDLVFTSSNGIIYGNNFKFRIKSKP